MAEPFIGEVSILPYTFAPVNFAYCSGQMYPISQNPALYSILGTTYGGDGHINFGIPNLKMRAPMHTGGNSGSGPGLTYHRLGEMSGSITVALDKSQLPQHGHTARAATVTDDLNSVPTNSSYTAMMIKRSDTGNTPIFGYRTPDANTTEMASQALANAGQSMGHDNRQPSLGLYFFIALEGLYPSRN